MKIAIAQLNPIIGDVPGNAEKILAAAQTAAEQGARLMLTPELSLCGYPPRDLLLRPGFIDVMGTTLAELAQQLPEQLAVLVGFVERNPAAGDRGGKPLFNSMALLKNGAIQQIFHKQLLPNYDVFDEHRYFEPGEQINHFSLADDQGNRVHIGVTICEDLWNDEEFWGQRKYPINPIAALAELGVDLVVNLSASPFTVQKQATREAMLGHSAARFAVPIVYTNQVGANDDLIFDGNSVAVDRQGTVVGRAHPFQPDLLTLTYDPHHRDLQPGHLTPPLTDTNAELWSALVLGVRDYAQKCGFTQAVIGLSGGIDSALVAAIAAAALGPEQVLGVLMPSPYSSDHSIADAQALADNLGIHQHTLAIGELMGGYDHTLGNLFAGTDFGVAEENIQSRIRGNLLMAIANKFGHLLLSTGNKSEMAVGYCTLYGDMNGGLAVIADVPKTRVYQLCQWLNHQGLSHPELNPKLNPQHLNPQHHDDHNRYPNVGHGDASTTSATSATSGLPRPAIAPATTAVIPPNILSKPPSAELKPGQMDQDSLPSYDVLDDILERLVQRHESVADMVAAGHDPAIVDRVIRLVSRAEFKRRQAPPVLKVTDRAFGTGWRMPIASRWHVPVPAPTPAVSLGSS